MKKLYFYLSSAFFFVLGCGRVDYKYCGFNKDNELEPKLELELEPKPEPELEPKPEPEPEPKPKPEKLILGGSNRPPILGSENTYNIRININSPLYKKRLKNIKKIFDALSVKCVDDIYPCSELQLSRLQKMLYLQNILIDKFTTDTTKYKKEIQEANRSELKNRFYTHDNVIWYEELWEGSGVAPRDSGKQLSIALCSNKNFKNLFGNDNLKILTKKKYPENTILTNILSQLDA